MDFNPNDMVPTADYQASQNQQAPQNSSNMEPSAEPQQSSFGQNVVDAAGKAASIATSAPSAPIETLHNQFDPNDMVKTSTWQDMMQAPIIGGFHMFDALSTTLLKAGAKAKILPNITPEAVQSTYDTNTDQFNKSMKEFPKLTSAGALAGGILQATPTMMIPGMQGAGIGSLAGAGKLAVNAASNMTQMGILGGMSTEKGQDPNQILNPEGALTGAQWGLGGTVAGTVLGSTIEGAARLKLRQDMAPGMKVFSSDDAHNSVLGNAWKWTVNTVLGNAPGALGTQGGRDVQILQAQKLMGDHLATIAQDTAKSGPVKVMNILNKHNDELRATESTLWDNFLGKVTNDPVARPKSMPILKEILDDPNQVAQLSTTKTGELAMLRQGLQADTPKAMKEFKGDVWTVMEPLITKDAKTGLQPAERTLLSNLKDLYGANIDDLKNAIQGSDGNGPALQAYEAANQFTKTYKQVFDSVPKLGKAVLGAQQQMKDYATFVKYMKSSSITPEEIKQSSKLLGKTGTGEIGAQVVQDVFKKSQTVKDGVSTLNISSLLEGLDKVANSPQAEISKPALESIKGYVDVLRDVAIAKGSRLSENARLLGATAVGTGVGAVGMLGSPATAASVMATPAVLSWFAKNSPIKNIIIGINKTANGSNAPVNAALINSFNNALIKAGMLMELTPDGSVSVRHEKDVPSAATPMDASAPVGLTGVRG